MDYKELVFKVSLSEEFHRDLLINALALIGYDTFEEINSGFKAYIKVSLFDQTKLEAALVGFKEMFDYLYIENDIPYKNWNQEWENNFEPLEIKNLCYVRATFHQAKPEFKYEIVIDPKMAFGTGHHQTTSMMMEWMLEENFSNKSILDMGCGTGILAILAAKMGALKITAIDFDTLCFESALENRSLNETEQIQVICGSKEVIPDEKVDIILANINRNILLDQLDRYVEVSNDRGLIFLSGFYEETDLDLINKKADSLGLKYIGHKTDNSWVAAKFSLI